MVLGTVDAVLPARHALLIGIPGCDNEELFEPIPERVIQRDVTRMAKSLAQSQYEITVLGVAPDADVPIERHIGEVPSRNRCLDEIQAACERVPPGGTLVIYFTGHGVRVGGADYLVPRDYTRLAPGGRHRPDRLIPANFTDEASSCRASLLLCVVDACRDEHDEEPGPAGNPSVPELPAGSFVLLRGCSPGETCQFDPEHGSLFTRALARALSRNESPRTLREVFQATKDKLRAQDVPQHPRLLYVGDLTPAIADLEICVGVRFLDDWRTAAEQSPLWGLVDRPEAVAPALESIRELVSRFGATVDGQRRRLMESSQLADVWSDDGYPERVLNGLYLLLTGPRREQPELRAAEVATLVVAPFFREAVLSLGLQDVADAQPRDLERHFGTGFRADFENILANNEQLARRGAGLARSRPEDRDILAMWLVHRWILEREDLWEGTTARHWSDELAKKVLRADGGPRVDDFARTLRTMLRSVGTVLGPVGDDLPADPVRARALGHLLSIAGVLGGDPRRMTAVLADHIGTHDPVDLRRLRDALESDARWVRKDDILIMDAVCDHPAVHACLEDLVATADAACTLARKAAEALPADQRALLVGVPKRCDEDLRPLKSAYDKPLLRFHLSGDRVRDLLMGTQLYGDAAVAIRELYQNALDACRYRHMRLRNEYRTDAPPNWSGKIVLRQGVEPETGRAYIECEDNGVGMTESVLRHAFTAAGSRFVHAEAFRREAARWRQTDPSYQLYPNSQFGIGVFSYFMLADEVFLWTAATDDRGLSVSADARLHLRIPGHGGLFRLLRDEPMPPAISSGGSVVRLYLSGGLDVSVTTLHDYLVVSEYRVETWHHGVLQESWEPHVPSWDSRQEGWPRGVAIRRPAPAEPRPGADNFWWVDGEGEHLADGLRIQPRRRGRRARPPVVPASTSLYGRLTNLTGAHQPRLNVSRDRLVHWDQTWAAEQALSAIPALTGWPGFTWSWLWDLGKRTLNLVSAIVERHGQVAVPVTTESGSMVAAINEVGYLPFDDALLRLRQPGGRRVTLPSRSSFGSMAPWRLAVWRAASGHPDLESPGVVAPPIDLSGFPTPTTDDAAALSAYQSARTSEGAVPSPSLPSVPIPTDGSETLFRLRRFVIAGLDLGPVQNLRSDDWRLIAAVLEHAESVKSPSGLFRFAVEMQMTLADVYAVFARLTFDVGLPILTPEDAWILDFAPRPVDAGILDSFAERNGPVVKTPSAVSEAYAERGFSTAEADRMVEMLRRLGFPFQPPVVPTDGDTGPLARYVGDLLTRNNDLHPGALTEVAHRFDTSELEVYNVVARRAAEAGYRLRDGLGERLPTDVPSDQDLSLAKFVGSGSDLDHIVGYQIFHPMADPAVYRATLFERNAHLVFVPAQATGADIVALAQPFDTTVAQAAVMIRNTFAGWKPIDMIDPIPESAAPLRPGDDEVRLLTRFDNRMRVWVDRILVISLVDRALPRSTIGEVIDRLAPYRLLGAPVPEIDADLAVYRPDEYDKAALTVSRADLTGEVASIDLVRVAGRLGWPVRTAYDRLHRFRSLGVALGMRREDCPDTGVVHWADLIVLSRYLDGSAPGLAGTVSAEQIRQAAAAVREEPAITLDRLRRYAALFTLEFEELP